ncbi:Uncharacterised protein [Vibrio cholerae]|nr:Uncharacterised protein [Vibrio cholerae]
MYTMKDMSFRLVLFADEEDVCCFLYSVFECFSR